MRTRADELGESVGRLLLKAKEEVKQADISVEDARKRLDSVKQELPAIDSVSEVLPNRIKIS